MTAHLLTNQNQQPVWGETNRNRILNTEIIGNGRDRHNLLKSLSYRFKAWHTQHDEQNRSAENSGMRSWPFKLGAPNKTEKIPTFFLPKSHFAFHYCKESKNKQKNKTKNFYKHKVFKIVRHNSYYAKDPGPRRCHQFSLLTEGNIK